MFYCKSLGSVRSLYQCKGRLSVLRAKYESGNLWIVLCMELLYICNNPIILCTGCEWLLISCAKYGYGRPCIYRKKIEELDRISIRYQKKLCQETYKGKLFNLIDHTCRSLTHLFVHSLHLVLSQLLATHGFSCKV